MPRVKTPSLVPVPAPVEVPLAPATAETVTLTGGEVAQATLQTIRDLVQPTSDETVVDAVKRVLAAPKAPEPAAPEATDADDADLAIRRILGHLLGIGPTEAGAVQMATMLSRKIRGS